MISFKKSMIVSLANFLLLEPASGTSPSSNFNDTPNWVLDSSHFDFGSNCNNQVSHGESGSFYHPSYERDFLGHTGENNHYDCANDDTFDWRGFETDLPSSQVQHEASSEPSMFTDFMDNQKRPTERSNNEEQDLTVDSNRENICHSNEPEGSEIVGVPVTSEYWKSLKYFPTTKTALIDKYCQLAYFKGQPIHRQLAAKRLKARCTEQIADDFLSNDSQLEQKARHCIDGPGKRSQHRPVGFLTIQEKGVLAKILIECYGLLPISANYIVGAGFNRLSDERRMQITNTVPKSVVYMTALAKELHAAQLTSRKGEQAWAEKYASVNEETTQAREHSSYWMSLPKDMRDLIMQVYTSYASIDYTQAWSKLDSRCSPRIATAFLSNDERDISYAIAVLAKVYRRHTDIFTEQEKELLHRELEQEYDITGNEIYKAQSMGTKKLSEEDKVRIKEDVRMGKERFEPLTRKIVENFRQARREEKRARYQKDKEAKAKKKEMSKGIKPCASNFS